MSQATITEPESTSPKTKANPNKSKREAGKEARREQLIKATIKCIARNGMSSTTMADISKEAGLSMGLANLHFQTKDKLLMEALRYVTDEYTQGWYKISQDDSLSAYERIIALIEYDFSAKITQRDKLAVWFAFWGEAKARPIYRKICTKNDMGTEDEMERLISEVAAENNYSNIDAEIAADGFTALADGLWLDILICPKRMPREKAMKIGKLYFANMFPDHKAAT